MSASTTDRADPPAPTRPARRLLSGVEAICEALVVRHEVDGRRGRDTATFVSGYPGSPLGTLDLALGRLGPRLAEHRIFHQPGLNEELAAAAVWGSQMGAAVPYEGVDGVVGAWYGKGPGLDRSGDVLKHANLMGTGPGGGAVLFVGDDPSAKSSTLPYDTNAPLADAGLPVLVPADQQDLLDLAVEAFRLSRACGAWVGVRVVTAVADGIGAVDTDPAAGRGGTSRRARCCAPTSRSCGSTAGCAPPRPGSRPAGSTGSPARRAAPAWESCAPAAPTGTCSGRWRPAGSAPVA
jgi:indolepyruvate ferredoxin oxidoreductase